MPPALKNCFSDITGKDILPMMILPDIRRRASELPGAISTTLGWVLFGPFARYRRPFKHVSFSPDTVDLSTRRPSRKSLIAKSIIRKRSSFPTSSASISLPPSDIPLFKDLCQMSYESTQLKTQTVLELQTHIEENPSSIPTDLVSSAPNSPAPISRITQMLTEHEHLTVEGDSKISKEISTINQVLKRTKEWEIKSRTRSQSSGSGSARREQKLVTTKTKQSSGSGVAKKEQKADNSGKKGKKNILHKLIRNAKRDYMNTFVTKYTSATKSLWSHVDNLCGRSKPETEIKSIINNEGQEITNTQQIVEEFGRYYNEVGKKQADNIPYTLENKEGEKDKMTNYRPICLISNVAKILEKLLKIRIVKFLEKNKIISEHQYGFREGKSTEDAIRRMIARINGWLDGRKTGLCVFVDLEKAFDTVSHKKLSDKLYRNGFRVRWINVAHFIDEHCIIKLCFG
ncbi:uncharacterized protein LOC123680842 [Harmonia axyridis]|uniref:uncharacterized protein LOC123680842 n=1 Tax=Harmonia axyridis TaxID=115357 RepID=UPI001E2766A2|nr:uncharacterized protein LOC123680842 [Harmonia axyridis]